MKKLALLIPFLISFLNTSFSQICNQPEAPGLTCESAPVLCRLDGYCSTLPNSNGGVEPQPFCGQFENNHWIKFVASGPNLVIAVTPSNCNQGAGLQGIIMSSPDCINFSAVSNCINGSGEQTFILNANALTIGEHYVILLDGKGGDVCDYSFEILSGSPDYPDAIAGDDQFLCENETVTLDGSNSWIGENVIFNWFTQDGNFVEGQSSLTPAVDVGGIYTIATMDTTANCVDTSHVEIIVAPELAVEIASPGILNCLTNQMVTLEPANYSTQNTVTQWRTIDGDTLSENIICQASGLPCQIVTAPGQYVLEIIDTVTACIKSDTVLVIADVNTPISDAGSGDELNCLISEIQLDGFNSSLGNQFEYEWTTVNGNILSGNSQLLPLVDAPGTYYLEVFNNDNGCNALDSVEITLNDLEPEGIDLTLDLPCYGESTGDFFINSVVSGNPPFFYAINDGVFSEVAEYEDQEIGDYHITIQDAVGCEWDTMFSIYPLEQVLLDLGEDITIKLGDSIQLQALTNLKPSEIDSIWWRPFDNTACPNCLDPFVRPFESIVYHATISDNYGCLAQDQITIIVDQTYHIYVPNAFSPNEDGTNDFLMIFAASNVLQINAFQVFNRWGGIVHESTNFQPNDPFYGWDGTLDGKFQNAGVFVYRAEVLFVDGNVENYSGTSILMR